MMEKVTNSCKTTHGETVEVLRTTFENKLQCSSEKVFLQSLAS